MALRSAYTTKHHGMAWPHAKEAQLAITWQNSKEPKKHPGTVHSTVSGDVIIFKSKLGNNMIT